LFLLSFAACQWPSCPLLFKFNKHAQDRQTDTCLTASFPGKSGKARTTKVKPIWILMKQKMMGWQWHQLDHMQITCTSLQTDNHASTSSLIFCRPDALPDAEPTASKH